MGRILPPVASLLLVALVFFVPESSEVRLAALECHGLFQAPVANDDAILGDVVLDGVMSRRAEDGAIEIPLWGVSVGEAGKDRMAELNVFTVARRSVVRGLRDAAAARGEDIRILGEVLPRDDLGGVNFHVALGDGFLRMEYTVRDTGLPVVVAEMPWTPPTRWSLLPPVVAIALAILLRRALPALFCGVLTGAFLLRFQDGHGVAASAPLALRDFFATFLWPELIETSRIHIVAFVILMLAMVGVMTRSGGMQGLMEVIAKRAASVRSTLISTWLLGLVVFFDDYANTILVGSTMRPLTDKWKIAREKLAYIVDSTAAPVAGLAIFSTWIAYEVSTFSAQLPAAGLTPEDGYAVFIDTLPYRFYCLLTLAFVGIVVISGRDLGPMLKAERRARHEGKVLRDGAQPMVSSSGSYMEPAPGVRSGWWGAVVPVFAFLGTTLFLIAWRGGAFGLTAGEFFSLEGFTGVLLEGSGNEPLMLGALMGLALAVALALVAKLAVGEIFGAAWKVVMSMGVAVLILYHAWMIGAVCDALRTAPFLSALVDDGVDPLILPVAMFALAGVVAFSTGTSWSTMSILLPIVVGLAYELGSGSSLAESPDAAGKVLMVMCIGAVLEGAIFGDHCSPISDTTVMSSIASASDHIDHVRTQAPYALLTMGTAIFCGYLPCAYFNLEPWIGLLAGIGVLTCVVLLKGQRPESRPG